MFSKITKRLEQNLLTICKIRGRKKLPTDKENEK